MKNSKIRKLSVVSMLCALAFLCTFLFKFKVSFLTFDFKDAVLAVTAFMYGPLYAVASAVVVAFIEFISISETGIYGFIMNSLSSVAFALICGLFYKYKRTLSGAVFGSICAVFGMTAVMLVANTFITPFYMGVERAQVVAMIPTLLLPFNLAKGIVNAAITMIIYKPITAALKKSGLLAASEKQTDNKKFIIVSSISLVALVAVVLCIIYLLNGNVIFGKN